MALKHIGPGEPVDVGAFGVELSNQRSHALFKSDQLEVLRVVLMAGKSIPPHELDGEVTLQCIEGRLEVVSEGQVTSLSAGQLLFLPGNSEHSVRAVEDASALLTIVLARNGSASR